MLRQHHITAISTTSAQPSLFAMPAFTAPPRRLPYRTPRTPRSYWYRLTREPLGEERRSHAASGISGPCCGRCFATIRPFEVYAECALARSPEFPFEASRMGTGRRGIDGMLTSAVLQMVGFCTRHPWPVIVIAAVLAISSALYTATHFAINTDTDQLLPKDLPWRQHELAYRDAF